MTISDVPCRAMRCHILSRFGAQAPSSPQIPGLPIPLSTIARSGPKPATQLTNQARTQRPKTAPSGVREIFVRGRAPPQGVTERYVRTSQGVSEQVSRQWLIHLPSVREIFVRGRAPPQGATERYVRTSQGVSEEVSRPRAKRSAHYVLGGRLVYSGPSTSPRTNGRVSGVTRHRQSALRDPIASAPS